MIADPGTEAPQVAEAVRRLGPPEEPPSFWAAIADDPGFRPSHRRTAVLQLVLRHVARGTTLGELGVMLGAASWLQEGDVEVVEDVGGALPVPAGDANTVVRISVLPDEPGGPCFVFVVVEGGIDRRGFLDALRRRPGAPDARIVDRATFPEDGIDAE